MVAVGKRSDAARRGLGGGEMPRRYWANRAVPTFPPEKAYTVLSLVESSAKIMRSWADLHSGATGRGQARERHPTKTERPRLGAFARVPSGVGHFRMIREAGPPLDCAARCRGADNRRSPSRTFCDSPDTRSVFSWRVMASSSGENAATAIVSRLASSPVPRSRRCRRASPHRPGEAYDRPPRKSNIQRAISFSTSRCRRTRRSRDRPPPRETDRSASIPLARLSAYNRPHRRRPVQRRQSSL
jgi:hypothetical protein